MEAKDRTELIIDYYYNPNVECTCEAIFAETHRSYCKRRIRPMTKPKDILCECGHPNKYEEVQG